MVHHFLDIVPVPALFLLTVGLALVAVELGYRLGAARRRHGGEDTGPVGVSVSGALGLLAFILAFAFGMATSRFDARRDLVLEDANAIRMCYLRADLIPEVQRTEARRLLREYVSIREKIDSIRGKIGPTEEDELRRILARSKEIHGELWTQATAEAEAQPKALTSLFIAACNNVIGIHEKRVNKGLESRIPGPVWILLYFVAAVSMLAVGYRVGLPDDRRSIGSVFLAVTFSTVIVLIADLDNVTGGIMRVSQLPIQKLQAELGSD